MRIAITREVSPSIAECELTHLRRRAIDLEVARAQHARYADALRAAGCEVRMLPADPGFPDGVFVEDAAVVFDEIAVIARPGAARRRGETEAVAVALAPFLSQTRIEPPATLDGGDVLRVGRRVFVGMSGRTDRTAVDQLEVALRSHGYTLRPIPVDACLHLKSAVTQVAPDAVLLNPRWVDRDTFAGLQTIAGRGIQIAPVDVSELQKAEGAVTCCSLVFEVPALGPP
jgi:dimethylargininase